MFGNDRYYLRMVGQAPVQFVVQYSPRGILAQPPPGLVNMTLFSALVTPLCGVLAQVARANQFEIGVEMHRNDAVCLKLQAQQFAFTGIDLLQSRLEDFLSWVGKLRASQLIGGQLGVETPRFLTAGLDLEDGAPIGYVVTTPDPAFANPIIPSHPAVLDAWLMYTQLSLERTMGPQFAEALGYVHSQIGPSFLAVMDRPGLPIQAVIAELERRYGLGKDIAVALFQLGDWHAENGLARLQQMRAATA
jgi:hypothetical protein